MILPLLLIAILVLFLLLGSGSELLPPEVAVPEAV